MASADRKAGSWGKAACHVRLLINLMRGRNIAMKKKATNRP
jgi:hypothetical protein